MGTPTPRRPLQPLRWWWVLLGIVFVVASMTGSTTWLLAVAGADRGLQIEAIRTGLTVGAGTGGAVALLLAVRRQWLNERAQAHQEDVAAVSEHDATERRVTDLYTKATDQLGSEKAAVRLGGLYALERLAQDHPMHRQTIVNVICAYLRMPYTPPQPPRSSPPPPASSPPPAETTAPTTTQNDPREERQVRVAAERILTEHLRPSAAQFWSGMRLDLTGATLLEFHLFDCHLAQGVFTDATFSGIANFSRTTFTRLAHFSGATFDRLASFYKTTFPDVASFRWATFTGDADFHGARFSGRADFHEARFSGHADFQEATFAGEAEFDEATFSRHARFGEATFSSVTSFIQATFAGSAFFNGARFSDVAEFSGGRVNDPGTGHVWPPGWTVWVEEDGSGVLLSNGPDQQASPQE